MEEILEDQGIKLLKDDSKYYLQYEAGKLMVKMKKIEINKDEEKEVILKPSCSYDIIVKYQDKGIYGVDC